MLRVFETECRRRYLGLRGAGNGRQEKVLTRNCMICTRKKIFSGDKIKKDELYRACDTHGGEEKCMLGFGGEI